VSSGDAGVAPSGEQVEIVLGDQRAVVVGIGGGLRSYTAAGREVLDGYGLHEAATSGRGQVLAPWPNRLQDGSYEFDGSRYQLPLTEPERANAIHGLVRSAVWTVGERQADRVVMEHLIQPQPGYPFTLQLQVEYVLTRVGLSVRTTATNQGRDACPYGCGHHPYLTLGTPTIDGIELRAPAARILTSDERGLPTGSQAVEGTDYDFRTLRAIGALRLDHAFTELERSDDGRARVELRDPASGRTTVLWVDEAYGFLMLFTGDPLPDVRRRSLAVEPMTCPPNAFRTGDSLIRLGPGQSATAAWGIEPS
jgi:aldose 1-epimerase